MPITTHLFDAPAQLRVLPIKEIRLTLTNDDVIKVRNPRDGASLDITPIKEMTDSGLEIAVAYELNLNFDITQNSLGYDKQRIAPIANNTVKVLEVFFVDDLSLKGDMSATAETTKLYVGGSSYNAAYSLASYFSMTYSEKQPIAHCEIRAILSSDYFHASGTWALDYNWQTYTW